MEFYANPHRRYNALNGDWILVSHRTKRPWQGQQETPPQDNRPVYDPECYLCPGNTRAGGHINPQYSKTFAFTNDFAALIPDVSNLAPPEEDLFKSESVKGTSRVICFSPNHNQSLAEMDEKVILAVVEFWVDQTRELSETYRWVQVFENKGAVMGSSNPHPHGQIWASDRLPVEPAKEDWQQRDYFHKNQSVLLLDYVERELQKKERIVCENEHWVVLVPFWAVWPFETLLLPRKQIRRLTDLKTDEKTALAAILKDLLVRYDNLFHISFPYTMGWHGAPFDAANADHWQLHAHFYPPLLRSASVKKFMVGYEMLAEAQRDITAEQAAEQLRNLPNVHYKSMAGFEK